LVGKQSIPACSNLFPQNRIILQRHGKDRIGWGGFDLVRKPALKLSIILADRRANAGRIRICPCAARASSASEFPPAASN